MTLGSEGPFARASLKKAGAEVESPAGEGGRRGFNAFWVNEGLSPATSKAKGVIDLIGLLEESTRP